jgi:ribosome-associated protein YbcJ (S4-like RNA binding protein)
MNAIISFLFLFLLISACIGTVKEINWTEIKEKTVEETTVQIQENESNQETSEEAIELTGFISRTGVFPSGIFYDNEIIQFFSSTPEGVKGINTPLIVKQVIPCEKVKVKGRIEKRQGKDPYAGELKEYNLIEVSSFQCIERN